MCHPHVTLCHPLKRCISFIYWVSVNLSPFIRFFLVLYLSKNLKKLESEKAITLSDPQ